MISALHQISPLKQHIPRCKPTLTRQMKKKVTNKVLSTMLTFFLSGRNSPTSMGLTAITIIINTSIGILRRLFSPLLGRTRLPHGAKSIQRRRNLGIQLAKSRRQNVVNSSACNNGQDGRDCRQHRPRARSHPRSSHGNSNSRSCTRLSY